MCYFQTFYCYFFTTAYWQKVNIVFVLKNVHVFMFLYSEALCAFSSRDLHYKIFWWRGTLCEEYLPQEKTAGKLQVQVGYASKAGFTLQSHRAKFLKIWLFCGHTLKRLRTTSLHRSTIQSWSWTIGLFTFHPFPLLLIKMQLLHSVA